MKRQSDPMGQAIADYYRTGRAHKLRVLSPQLEDEEMPVDYLFRAFEQMPLLERLALSHAHGRVLDVGAGAGSHALELQRRGFEVTAIDISPRAVETMRLRGVSNALEQDFFAMRCAGEAQKFHTILMLMNGLGLAGKVSRLPALLQCADRLLAPGGQLLCDSTDVAYLYEEDPGARQLPRSQAEYYGEITYQMRYGRMVGDAFPWLFVDFATLRAHAERCGFKAETLSAEPPQYLARLTRL